MRWRVNCFGLIPFYLEFVGTSVESSSKLQNHINPSHVEAKPLPHTWGVFFLHHVHISNAAWS